MKYLIDTNVLLDNLDIINHNITIPTIVLEELDKLKTQRDTSYLARQAIKKIYKNLDHINIVGELMVNSPDNEILEHARKGNYKLITNDINMMIKAKSIGVESDFTILEPSYSGYRILDLSENELSSFYLNQLDIDALENEYLILKDGAKVIDQYKRVDGKFIPVKYKVIDNRYVGRVKPRNLEQELYMDMLQDEGSKIKVVTGNYGTGKDYLALAYFLNLLEKGKYDKLLWIRNNIEVEGTNELGFLPGNITEKLLPFAEIIGDFLGEKSQLEYFISSGRIELIHPGFLRGRNIANSILYCTEAQNLTGKLIKLIITRVAEGSIVFFNGDVKQSDSNFLKVDSGLNYLINKLKGQKLFGYVHLVKTERSEVANIANLLD